MLLDTDEHGLDDASQAAFLQLVGQLVEVRGFADGETMIPWLDARPPLIVIGYDERCVRKSRLGPNVSPEMAHGDTVLEFRASNAPAPLRRGAIGLKYRGYRKASRRTPASGRRARRSDRAKLDGLWRNLAGSGGFPSCEG